LPDRSDGQHAVTVLITTRHPDTNNDDDDEGTQS
jgi:hypothetical protein